MIIKRSELPAAGLVIRSDGAPLTDTKEKVVCDLHIGKAYRVAGDANRKELPKSMFLKPNDCILLETEEELEVPAGMFGLVVSKAGLAAEGIIVATLKIDPHFTGRLTITVINVGKRFLRVEPGMSFCCVFFQSMTPADGGARVPPDAHLLPVDQWKARIRNILPLLLTFLLSVAASVAAAYLYLLIHGANQ
jgi:deoxycytidine triphosphate deaminase